MKKVTLLCAKLAYLFCLVWLTNGCATTMLFIEMEKGAGTKYDTCSRVDRAYATPKGELLISASGTLIGSRRETNYTIRVPQEVLADKLQQIRFETGTATPMIVDAVRLPREVVEHGVVRERDIKRLRLTEVAVSPIILLNSDVQSARTIEEALREIQLTGDIIFKLADRKEAAFLYVHVPPNGTPHALLLWISGKEVYPNKFLVVLTPITMAVDIAAFPISIPLAGWLLLARGFH